MGFPQWRKFVAIPKAKRLVPLMMNNEKIAWLHWVLKAQVANAANLCQIALRQWRVITSLTAETFI
jgi:hypothetical protein